MAKKPTPYDENGRFNGMRAPIESAIGPIVDPIWGRHRPIYVARTDRLGSLVWYEREAYHTPWELSWP